MNTRTVILNCGDQTDSLKYYPYIAWAWNQLGWDTMLFYLGKHSLLLEQYKPIQKHFAADRNKVILLSQIEGYDPAQVVNASKYFGGCCYSDNRILMTAGMSILPVKNVWQPQPEFLTVYSNDGHGVIMTAATAPEWRRLMGISDKMGLDLEIKKYLDGDKGKGISGYRVPQFVVQEPDTHFPGEAIEMMPERFNLEQVKQYLHVNFKKLPLWLEPSNVRTKFD